MVSHQRCRTNRLQMRDHPTAADDRTYRCQSWPTDEGSNTPTLPSRSAVNDCSIVGRQSRVSQRAKGNVKVRFRRAFTFPFARWLTRDWRPTIEQSFTTER